MSVWLIVPAVLVTIVVAVIVAENTGSNADFNRAMDESSRLNEQLRDRETQKYIEVLEKVGSVRHCPHCREKIEWGATRCPFCRSELKPTEDAK